MELGLLLTISCVMTTIAMIFLIVGILFIARYGGQGVKTLVDRVMGGGDDNKQAESPRVAGQAQAAVASSSSLRQRAQQLDFPAPASGVAQFGAQSAGSSLGQNSYPDFPAPQNQGLQQASLRPRGQYPDFPAPQSQGTNSAQSFQASTPSLSPSRPFQAGSSMNARPQQNQSFGQQAPNPLGQAPQQGLNRQGIPPLGGNQQGFGGGQTMPSQSQQGGFPPLGQAPQQGFNQQGIPPLGGNQQGFSGGQTMPSQSQQGGFPPLGQAPQQGLNRQGIPPLGGNQQGFGGQPRAPQVPQQGGLAPLGGNQQGFGGQIPSQQGQAPQQAPNPQFGGLGGTRPPLRSVPRPTDTNYDRPIGGRDSRKGDDRDSIYDDGRGGSNFIDEVGDFLDNV